MEGHAHFGRKYRLSVEVTIKALNLLVISVIEILTILFEEIENIIWVLISDRFIAFNLIYILQNTLYMHVWSLVNWNMVKHENEKIKYVRKQKYKNNYMPC